MTTATISGKQMKRLQTLWGLFCRHANLDAKDREARLGWVAGAVGRQISSFKELTAEEARTAIDAVQKHLPAEMLRSKRPSRATAQAYGTAGRRKDKSRQSGDWRSQGEVRMVDGPTLELLGRLRAAAGWTKEREEALLRSRKSPVKSGKIRTLAEANPMIWFYKRLLRRAERSEKARSSPASMEAGAPNDSGAPAVSAEER